MRLNYFRRLPSLVFNLWPCKVFIVILLVFQIFYLLDFPRTITTKRCLNLRKLDANLQKYPVICFKQLCLVSQIFRQQNVPKLSSTPLNWIQFDYKIHAKCLRNSKAIFIVHTKGGNFERRSHFRSLFRVIFYLSCCIMVLF